MLRAADRWPLDGRREVTPHKLSGVTGCHICNSGFCQGQTKLGNSCVDRQLHSSGIYQPQGGDKINKALHLDKESMELVPSETSVHNCISHIPGKQNVGADLLSRSIVDRHDWKLNSAVFQAINSLWGPLQVDLFASRITKQLPRFFSWTPDPLAEAVDAFKQTWTEFTGYANPPWGLIGRCVQYTLQQGATIVLITPCWPSQPWYPTLFPLLLDNPRLLPLSPDLLTSPQGLKINLPERANQLVAWYISGNRTKIQEYQMKLLHSYLPRGEAQQLKTTILPGESGSNGAFSMAPIQFLPL